ncbi:MAG: ribosome silencing factor [Lachnospiraceae bacterium]|nr:ribosome silencing factor [Lachnospiraceae bacterium]MBQ7863309.1 ribosome silencing factor [Lachnospiraceae bacterium]MBQ8633658.1 ribosome silencing factor [Lachnospiraceae bacterium]MBQ8785733.1 ribosome silencing factor [Alphaproteobacteria bacterium]
MERSKLIVKKAYEALNDKKGEDIKIIEIGKLSTVADYFIIANGSNAPHVESLVDNVEEELLKEKIHAERIEGVKSSGWILMDYNDVVVHVFSKEDRLFYDLERIWRDGKEVDIETL